MTGPLPADPFGLQEKRDALYDKLRTRGLSEDDAVTHVLRAYPSKPTPVIEQGPNTLQGIPGALDQAMNSTPGNFARATTNAATMNFEPKITAALSGGGADVRDAERAKLDQFSQEHPALNTAAQLLGGTASVFLGRGLLNKLFGNALTLRGGAKVGAALAATQAAGGTNDGSPVDYAANMAPAALTGALQGGAAGGVLGKILGVPTPPPSGPGPLQQVGSAVGGALARSTSPLRRIMGIGLQGLMGGGETAAETPWQVRALAQKLGVTEDVASQLIAKSQGVAPSATPFSPVGTTYTPLKP